MDSRQEQLELRAVRRKITGRTLAQSTTNLYLSNLLAAVKVHSHGTQTYHSTRSLVDPTEVANNFCTPLAEGALAQLKSQACISTINLLSQRCALRALNFITTQVA